MTLDSEMPSGDVHDRGRQELSTSNEHDSDHREPHVKKITDPLVSVTTTTGEQDDGIPQIDSPTPASATEGGREINPKVLHVSNIEQSIDERSLEDLFAMAGPVLSIRMLPDRQRTGFSYAFIQYDSEKAAKLAQHALDGRVLNNNPIKIGYAFQSQQAIKDSENYTNIFVGDLSSEVNDEILSKAFQRFGSMVEARVMWDMTTGRSRSYGFVSFKDASDAARALEQMDGEWLGSRPIRCNWAQRSQFTPRKSASPTHYEQLVRQAASWQTTIYIGNLSPYTTFGDLLQLLQTMGFVVDLKHNAEKGYAFAKYDTHERAAMAIVNFQGCRLGGRVLRCGWGKS